MVRVAIIGVGVMGKNHYRVLKGLPGAEVAALCDPNPNGRFEEKIYPGLDRMLSSEKSDAAVISVPTSLHKDIALKCMGENIHVLIEKPVASTAKDGYEILDAAARMNMKAAVGYVERFNPVVLALKNEIRAKKVFSISVTRVGPFPPRVADVGILTDLAVHDIDLIRFITGKEIKQANVFKSRKIHSSYEDNAALSFELEDEIVASITTNWLTPFKKRKIEVATEDAYYEADLITQDLIEYSSYRSDGSYVARNCFVRKEEPLKNELQAFIEFIRDGRSDGLASVKDSIETLKVVEEVREASGRLGS